MQGAIARRVNTDAFSVPPHICFHLIDTDIAYAGQGDIIEKVIRYEVVSRMDGDTVDGISFVKITDHHPLFTPCGDQGIRQLHPSVIHCKIGVQRIAEF
ncbi:MAG: hypothetical protein IPL86_12975 [Flavobacteriales bacterium]|nr:hypothetical protein [Flavobacteriales bacterium]